MEVKCFEMFRAKYIRHVALTQLIFWGFRHKGNLEQNMGILFGLPQEDPL